MRPNIATASILSKGRLHSADVIAFVSDNLTCFMSGAIQLTVKGLLGSRVSYCESPYETFCITMWHFVVKIESLIGKVLMFEDCVRTDS
jgi:hypothetical protein